MTQLILPVPHVSQRQQGECLAACVAMMLLHLGQAVNYDHLLKLLRVKSGIGAPISNVLQLDKLGLSITYRQGTWSDLQNHLLNNQPCLTPVQSGELPYWTEDTYHAVVVIGLDDDNIYLNDPALPASPISAPRGDFDLAWLARDEMYAVLTQI